RGGRAQPDPGADQRVGGLHVGERVPVAGAAAVTVAGQGGGAADQEQPLRARRAEGETGRDPAAHFGGAVGGAAERLERDARPAVRVALERTGLERRRRPPAGGRPERRAAREGEAAGDQGALVHGQHGPEGGGVLEQRAVL